MNNILVEVHRGNLAENLHRGHICIVGKNGKVLKSIGNTDFLTYLRSCAKPIQAIPVITTGAAEKFKLSNKELTIFSGSLNGQDFQVDILKSILDKLGLDESYLRCGIHPPSHRETRKKIKNYTPLHNNCAGKHLAMLALCKFFDFPLENYDQLEHPVQQLILKEISYFTEIPVNNIKIGTDGCGVPVFAVPMYNFALAYYKLSNADILDEKRKYAVKLLMKNSIKYPELIAGDERICTELMRVKSNIFAKVGADGSYGIAAFHEKFGIAIKIESGNMRALNVVVIELLKQLEILSESDVEKLDIFYNIPVFNHRKEIVGRFKPVFKI
jgi:L-asparaginase II